jgi:glycosyltransferase involved in cell wall biosynthesis
LVRRIALLGLADSVDMLGYVSGADLERAYRSAVAFVLPSYFAEGFPLAIMEAMDYGLAVITTPIRGSADHLVAEENALFVPAHDPETLAREIERLLDDDALRERMGVANRAKVAQFVPENVMPRYAEILRRVVATGESGA